MAIAHLTRRLDKIESKALANHPRIVFVKAMIPRSFNLLLGSGVSI
jgi:hypothetical protein